MTNNNEYSVANVVVGLKEIFEKKIVSHTFDDLVECLPYNKVFGKTVHGPNDERLYGFYIFEKDSFYGLFLIENIFLDTSEIQDIVNRFETYLEFQIELSSKSDIYWYPKEQMVGFLNKLVLKMYDMSQMPTKQFLENYVEFIHAFDEHINPRKKTIRDNMDSLFSKRWEALCAKNNLTTKEDLCKYVIKENCDLLKIKPEQGEGHVTQSTSFGIALEYMGLVKEEWVKQYLSTRSGGGFREHLETLPSDVGSYLS